MQAVRVQQVGRIVGGHHDNDPLGEQTIHQASQNHRIGDIGDVKLVEAQQTHIPGHLLGDLAHRIIFTLVLVQVAMNLLHEGMKVETLLATIRY